MKILSLSHSNLSQSLGYLVIMIINPSVKSKHTIIHFRQIRSSFRVAANLPQPAAPLVIFVCHHGLKKLD